MSLLNYYLTELANETRKMWATPFKYTIAEMANNLRLANVYFNQAKDEIAKKGVAVPDTVCVNDLPFLIEQIVAGGGSGAGSRLVVDRSITEYEDDVIESIGSYAFCGCDYLASVNAPKVTRVRREAFKWCRSLTSIYLPLAEYIDYYAFAYSALTTVDLPAVDTLDSFAFRSCTSLTDVNLPSVVTVGNGSFCKCTKLKSLALPAATSIGQLAFSGATSLEKVVLPLTASIDANAFADCSSLSALILRSETMCPLLHCNALESSAIGAGVGYVYVPAALVDTYRSAANWSVYASQFRAIENFPSITGG